MIKKTYVSGNEVQYNDRETSNLVFIDAGARIGEIFGKVPGSGTFFTTESGTLEIDKQKVINKLSDIWSPYPFDTPNRKWSESEIHLFEPNSDYHSLLFDLAKNLSRFCVSVTVHPSAVWIQHEMRFMNIYESGLGSTLLDRGGEKQGAQMISCISFKEFLNSLQANDIHVKMDIEGSEYDVLYDILIDPVCLKKLSSLSVEWHRDLFPEKAAKFWYLGGHRMIGAAKEGIVINWWPGEF